MNFTAVRESHLAYIPVAHIVDDPAFCFRQPADPMIADIRSSFLRHGQTHPVTLETLSDGKYRVLDGHRRYRAVAQIRAEGGAWEKLLAHALPVGLSPLDQFRVLRERNDGASSSFGLAERSRFFAALWRQGVGVAAIAAEYSFSVAEVEDHLELAEAPAHLAVRLDEVPMGVTFAAMLARRYAGWSAGPYTAQAEGILSALLNHAATESLTIKSWRFLLDFYWGNGRPFMTTPSEKC